MGFFDFFQSDLCNEKQLQKIGKRFSGKLIKRAENSTYALIIATEFVKNISDETKPVEDFFMNLRKKINQNSFDELDFEENRFPEETSATIATTSKFLYYYITRLPIVLRGTTYQKKQFSKKERNYITNCCLREIHGSKYANNFYVNNPYESLKQGYDYADRLCSEEKRMAYINDYNLFFRGRSGYNEILQQIKDLSQNEKFVLSSMLDEYFSIYYQSFQDHLVELIFSTIAYPIERD